MTRARNVAADDADLRQMIDDPALDLAAVGTFQEQACAQDQIAALSRVMGSCNVPVAGEAFGKSNDK